MEVGRVAVHACWSGLAINAGSEWVIVLIPSRMDRSCLAFAIVVWQGVGFRSIFITTATPPDHTRSRSMIIQRVLEFFAAEHAGNHPPKTSGMPRGRRDATTRPTEAARRGRRCVRAPQYSSRTREAGSSGTKLFLASQLAFFVRAGPADFARPTHLPGPYSHSPVSAECSIWSETTTNERYFCAYYCCCAS